ncbi:NADH-quinone oxidoreductase subunit 5 family protein [Methanocorpusculum bavaricum]|uniref:NADH-quinone oxidoreductase subunit 5 family protein n=1 Tax=Methanocorpusculum bavaricum TaxID=71518 RepID=UPI0005B29ED2|nr:proton-conducting transporter membrane subunit [Methanocorpusculum bavaricum]
MYPPELIAILILLLVPVSAAVLLAVFKPDLVRNILAGITSVIIIGSSVFLAWKALLAPVSLTLEHTEWIGMLLFIAEIGVALVILGLSIKYRKILPLLLSVVQLILILILELFGIAGPHAMTTFTVTGLSAVMVLIIGIIGTLICVYALGYMKDYHDHQIGVPVRKRYFFALMFLFLSAMFGLVLFNNLMWILCAWEVTTLCSFLLIGYSRTPEAVKNAFRAVWMNLIGGICFTLAIFFLLRINTPVNLLSVTDLLAFPNVSALTIPLAFIAVAGLTKAAQMPFSTWLTGAMVAPTPVSALLHSSTMVKAGVYLLVLFAPLFSQTWVGIFLALIGAFTFLATSALAISQSNAKKVLAYSTIANLGLITACAGIGTAEAIMAAILLIIFHAVAKALLFLCVGAVEHKIGSRDIEDMDGLLVRLPLLSTMMVIGISGMYLAPFGMLISKWAALEAFLTAPLGCVFIAILAFGSAFTIFFWTKWLGKLFMRMNRPPAEKIALHISEKLSVIVMGVLVIGCCLGFPAIITGVIIPYLNGIRPYFYLGNKGFFYFDTLVMLGLMAFILLFLVIGAFLGSREGRTIAPYLGGRAVDSEGRFLGSLGVYKEAKTSNYYLEEYCGEKALLKPSWVISGVLIIVMLVLGFMGVMIWI